MTGPSPSPGDSPAASAVRPLLTPALRSTLLAGAETLQLSLDERAVERFTLYLQELLSWNQKHNLTAIRDPAEVITRHFLDSLTCTLAFDFTSVRPVMDVGAGAGFPGLPLKIAFPSLSLTLLDSSVKKIEFLQHLCPLLGFMDVNFVHARAEEFGHVGSYRGKFAAVLSRAVAPLPTLLELCMPFVSLGGVFIAQKNRDLGEELTSGAEVAPVLGGGELEQIEVTTPETDLERSLIVVRKEESTPSAYPRRPGIPAKRPLTAAGGRRTHPKYR